MLILLFTYVFQLDVDFLKCEDFLVGDLRVGKQRHLIFATPFLTEELTEAFQEMVHGQDFQGKRNQQ